MEQDMNSTVIRLDSARIEARELLGWLPAALIYGGVSYLAMLLLF